jgi:hypothetical protein
MINYKQLFKTNFIMKKTKLMAIIAMSATSLFFASCHKDGDSPQSALESEYFTVQNVTVQRGEIPQSSSASMFSSVTINRNVLPGSSSFVSLNSEERITEIYVGVAGVNEYYRLATNAQASQAAVRAAAAANLAQFVILFSQNLSQSFTIQISAMLSNGSLTSLYTAPLQFVSVGTGALQVSLSFDNDKDVDLYVVEPDGSVIYYGNKGGSMLYDEETGQSYRSWGLDLDSNPGCSIDGVDNENVYYPAEYIQSGKYEVWVNMYQNCNSSIPTNWVITATKQGGLVPVTYGQNPASGVYPVGTPSNSIGSSLNGALKVMEFTMSGSAQQNAHRMSLQSPDESAVKKLNKANNP